MPSADSFWLGARRPLVALLVALLAAFSYAAWEFLLPRAGPPLLRSAPVKRGDVVATIGATGTLEPEAAVDIGAQVAGIIVAFGKDKNGNDVTWGTSVEAGDVLARIDDSLYVASVKSARGQLDQYTGQLARDQAILERDRVDLERYRRLARQDSIALQQAEDQAYVVEQDEGTVKLDAGLVEGGEANLLTAQTNLGYCTIRSPVKGVIVDRRVNIGQTVVSSLSAPSLFLIANDLRRIQAWISVNEADVGSIAHGQPVTFTVDAVPGRIFRGVVGQVRLNATMTQNVVTYTVEVDIDNPEGILLPYLTANAQFEVGRQSGVLLVPNAALRWAPKPAQIAPAFRQEPKGPTAPSERAAEAASPKVPIWILDGGFVRPLFVRPGLSDGVVTEVEGKGLIEGLPVVLGEGSRGSEAAEGGDRNPFAPQLFRGQSGGQGQAGAGQQTPGAAEAR